ncbi:MULTISPECIES: single stranded DNA-binding domain-containing protein [Caproicibacterium]|uniref:Uncharacterized protein n=1 Tax=Caproicibacterium argilliputei TaxID=3030016 RepID=A0AA97D8K4_9FIRM|nr:hypothetical protein [Caproicibacterium argilliputei]WOC31028.1 hypothetical protein PXC00_07225 [Caproicibacterium argilliputei]
MHEEKKILWTARLAVCAVILVAGLVLRFAVGGQVYVEGRSWYFQQVQNSVQPNLSLQNIQKQCRDFLSSGASLVSPQMGQNSAPSAVSGAQSGKSSSQAPASMVSGAAALQSAP